jgi:hypothetical protein
MNFNFNQALGELLTDQLIDDAAQKVQENTTTIRKALTGISSVVLLRLISKGIRKENTQGVYNMSKVAAGTGFLSNLISLLGDKTNIVGILNMTKVIFGDDMKPVSRQIVAFSGIREDSAIALLKMMTPAALALLGQEIKQQHIKVDALPKFLDNQYDKVRPFLPSEHDFSSFKWIEQRMNVSSVSVKTMHTSKKKSRFEKIVQMKWKLSFSIIAFILAFYLIIS